MNVKIITDSASNMLALDGVPFASVPLRIVTDQKEYIDHTELDVQQMVQELHSYSGRSQTACPGMGDWLQAFEDYERIFCVTIISRLSGSYNAAMAAKREYEESHPGRKVFVLDSYSAGPEMKLLLNELKEMVLEGKDFDTICREIQEYKNQHTSLVFSLQSLRNLANNGRVSPAAAKICGIVGIRVVGDVNEEGLHPTDKCRGEKKAISELLRNMKRLGYHGKRVLIDHCYNENGAMQLKDLIQKEYPQAEISVNKTRGLCSFYAEKGGLMVGFER
nr:DegV family protein [uncultured Blautia sp.]